MASSKRGKNRKQGTSAKGNRHKPSPPKVTPSAKTLSEVVLRARGVQALLDAVGIQTPAEASKQPSNTDTDQDAGVAELNRLVSLIRASELTVSQREEVRLRHRAEQLLAARDPFDQKAVPIVVDLLTWEISLAHPPIPSTTPDGGIALYQDSDPDIAAKISDDKLCLLVDPKAQDALARWMYAAYASNNPTAKSRAKQQLDGLFKVKQGRRRRIPELDPVLFLSAREALRSFIEIQLGSVPENASVAKVRKSSPVFVELKKEYGVALKGLKDSLVAGPTPSDISAQVIGKVFGIEPDTVWKLGTDAKKALPDGPASA
jgi:hypothetical protein